MRIIAHRSLKDCWKKYPKTKISLSVWEERILNANCTSHDELRFIFPNADYISNPNFRHLTIFNINGNEFRLAADIFFNSGQVFLKWFGKHSTYDKINFNLIKNSGFILC